MVNFEKLDYTLIKPQDMPTEIMQAVAESCSVKTAIILMDSFGGRMLNIPSKRRTGLYNEMSSVLSKEDIERIFTTFSGETLTIPTRKSILKLILRQLRVDKHMIAYLTYSYGVNRSTIYRLLKKAA